MRTNPRSFRGLVSSRLAGALAVGIAFVFTAVSHADTASTWNSAAGNWFVNSNWTPQTVPNDLAGGGPYLVTITGSDDVVMLDIDPTITNLTLGGGATLTGMDAQTVNVTGTVSMTGGTLGGTAKLIAATLNWTGGTMSGTAVTEVPAGGALTLSGGTGKTLSRTLSVAPGITASMSGGSLTLSNGGVLGIGAGAGLNITDGAGFLGGTGGGSVNLGGTLVKTGVSATSFTSGAALNNSGLVQINGSRIDLAGGTSSGTFQTAAGTELRFVNGTHTVTAGTSFTGPGLFIINGGAGLTANGDVSLPNLTVNGMLTANATVTVESPDLQGTVNGTGNLIANGASQWRYGASQSGSGTTTVPSGATMTKDTANIGTLHQRTVEVGGSLVLSGGGNNGIQIENGGTIHVLGGGLLHLTNNAGFGSNTSGTIHNEGTFRKSGAATISLVSSAVSTTNSGTIDVQAGQLQLGGGSSTGAFVTAAGTILAFNGAYSVNAGSAFTGGGSMDINGTLTANADFSAPNLRVFGTLTGPGQVTVTGAGAAWGQTGVMSGVGKTIIAAGATMTKDTANIGTLHQRTVEVGGSLVFSGSNSNGITLANGGTIHVLSGGLLDFTNNVGFGSITSGLIHNQGTFRKSGGTGVSGLANVISTTNSGVIEVQTGQLHLGGGSGTGTFTAAAGTKLAFNGAFALNAGAIFSGAGSFEVNGTLTANADVSIPNLRMLNALNGAGSVTMTGAAGVFGPGTTFSGAGTTVIAAGATVTKDTGNPTTINQRALTIAGRLVTNTAGSNGIVLQGSAPVVINAGGELDFQSNVAISYSGGGSSLITNAGTLRKSAGTGVSTIDTGFAVTSSGLIEAQTGTLAFSAGFTQTAGETKLIGGNLSGTTFAMQGGTLRGSGTLTGAVNNAGATISPGLSAGTLAINGALTCGAGSILEFELGGTAAGTQYDTMTSAATTLGGLLRVKFINGFENTVTGANTFTLLDSSSPSLGGAFSNVASGSRLYTTDGHGSFLVTYNTDKINLSDYQAGGPPDYSTWATLRFPAVELLDPLVSGPAADPDHDGRNNLLEYALGGLPKNPDTTGQPTIARNGSNIEYTWHRDTAKTDITYHCESSDDLVDWDPHSSTLTGTTGTIQTMQATSPASAAPLFFRLRILKP